MSARFSSLRGHERATALCDAGRLELLWVKEQSPLLLGEGAIEGRKVLLVLLDGHVRGGTLGVEEAAAMTELLQKRLASLGQNDSPALLLALDTGGVRVEEGPRALAATSAAGVLLAEWSLRGSPMVAVVSGPRGCFGAPSVMAALPDRLLMVEGSHWGLTGPRLFSAVQARVSEAEGLEVTSARERHRRGTVDGLVQDDVVAIRGAVSRFLGELTSLARPSLRERVEHASQWLEQRCRIWRESGGKPAEPRRRRRDLLSYSFRHQWQPQESVVQAGLVQAAWGELAGTPALGIIVGPAADEHQGIGVVEAHAIVTKLVRCFALPSGTKATILNFVFCQGHVVDLQQERMGLPRALGECLRAYVAAKLAGHTVMSVLGGGTYGAAYLALAAPSRRILAIRGTKVAPMAPAVLKAFQSFRRATSFPPTEQALAERIPEVEIVESIVRLPRVLKEVLVEDRRKETTEAVTHAA